MKKKNKVLKIIIIVLMVIFLLMLGFVACGAYGAYHYWHSMEFEYSIDKDTNTATITGISTDDGILIIPDEIDGYPVKSIGDYAFKNNSNILIITLPDTISYIGKGAFYNCTELRFVNDLKKCDELKAIEDETFYNCKALQKIELPSNITSIGSYAFKSCYCVESISVPNSVSYIGKYAFDNCQALKEFNVPQGVTKIEEGTFLSCLKLESIRLPKGITSIDTAAFANCYALKVINIPTSVETIGKQAFATCKALPGIILPEGLKAIGEFAFTECYSLAEITLPASVESLGTELFDWNTSLENIYVDPNNLKYTSVDGVLYNKDLTKLISYPAGKKSKSFAIPETVDAIADCALVCNADLESINISKNVTAIGRGILIHTSIKAINYQGSVDDWNKITKSAAWDTQSADYTVYCTDGQIAKNGTVTYK